MEMLALSTISALLEFVKKLLQYKNKLDPILELHQIGNTYTVVLYSMAVAHNAYMQLLCKTYILNMTG